MPIATNAAVGVFNFIEPSRNLFCRKRSTSLRVGLIAV
jgi:hypothetical protein